MFDGEGPSYVELTTPATIVDKCGYTLANPTAAGLVKYSKDWPGVRTRVGDIGQRTLKIERPPAFFAEDGTMPAVVEIPLELAEAVIETYGVKQARERIAEAVARHEAKGHAEAAAKGWAFKGAERVLKSSPFSRAKTLEQRRELNPRYAGPAAVIETAVAREAHFRERYAIARERGAHPGSGCCCCCNLLLQPALRRPRRRDRDGRGARGPLPRALRSRSRALARR